MRHGITPEYAPDRAALVRASFRQPIDGLRPADHASLPLWLVARILAVTAAIQRHRPAVVHCWLDGPGVAGALSGCTLGAPRILIQQGSLAIVRRRHVQSETMLQAYRALAHSPTVTVLNNSKAGARDNEDWIRLRPGTIAVLHNGFVPDSARTPEPEEIARFRASLGLSSATPVVGTIMRFVAEKDPDLWLDTAAEIAMSRPDVRFLIGGFGPLEQTMIERIDGLGLRERVVLAGSVTDAGLAYSAMDVVLLTSAIEGLPNVMIEAQAVGRPVIAPDVGGTSEAVLEGRTGAIARPRSAASLAKAVIAMLDDADWRERVRIAGPDFVADRFGLERMIDETLGHYGFVAGLRS
jgi:glycosyltransferase involved in cell wall biosynthesis